MKLSNRDLYTVIPLLVNGRTRHVKVRPADTLLHVLRSELGLTGTKMACENGDCGACDVLVNGKPMHSCLLLAVEARQMNITTVEGLKDSPVVQAFVDHFAIQCGYCTPGFVVSSHALVTTHPEADDELIKEWLRSNLCRCTGYQEIYDAVRSVLRQQLEKTDENPG